MKITALFLSAAFVLAAVWQIGAHNAKTAIRQFSVGQLTPQQIAACSAFKASSNKPRHSELELVQKLGILPSAPLNLENNVFHKAKVALQGALPGWIGGAPSIYDDPPFIMTRENVTDLLGEPSSSNTSSLQYQIGFLDGSYHIFIVRLHNGHVVGTGGMAIH